MGCVGPAGGHSKSMTKNDTEFKTPEKTDQFTVNLEGGKVGLNVKEQDGTYGEVELTAAVDYLMRIACQNFRTDDERAEATAELGELWCDDEVRFYKNGDEIPATHGLEIVSEGLYWVIRSVVDEYREKEASVET